MATHDSITVLHVSDMQFGKNHRFAGHDLPPGDAQYHTLFQKLSDDLEILEGMGIQPQVIVVSGDLAEWGMKSEFDDAYEFLVKLCERLKVPRKHVVIVPGNHDINRKLCESYFLECEGEGEKPVPPFWPKWKPYHAFFERFYQSEEGIQFAPAEPWTFYRMEQFRLVVAGLNSTMVESHEDGTHHGGVGEEQLHLFRDKLKEYREKGWFRLGVVHHNVVRGAEKDDENLRDAERLKTVIGPSLNLILHGHTHDAKTAWVTPKLPIISTGSAALETIARPPEVPNQYQVLRIWPHRLERWTRGYAAGQERWIADTRCSDSGNEWHVTHEVAFDQVSGTFPAGDIRKARDQDFPSSLPEPEAGRYGGASAPGGMISKVKEICELQNAGVQATIVAGTNQRPAYLQATIRDGAVIRQYPVGVCSGDFSAERLEAFTNEVHAQYRADDRLVRSVFIYGGDRIDDAIVREALKHGVCVLSLTEYRGLIDFSDYLAKQTAALEGDIVYPPDLYVEQRLDAERGTQRIPHPSAYEAVVDWLAEERGRFVLILASAGTGKTFLLHELARRLPQTSQHLVPILIELRALEKARSLEELIAQHLTAKGERYIDHDKFTYMLRAGHIVLLFDGFDELESRITYERAVEHMSTLLQAANGEAKIVVTSRTEHFISDGQVKKALLERSEQHKGFQLAHLQPFSESEIRAYLQKRLRCAEAAKRRFELIHDIQDLLGLSQNPRMLGFIVNLPEERLVEVKASHGKISAAELYRLLLQEWLENQVARSEFPGGAPTLSVEERWQAVASVALCLWPKRDATLRLSDLEDSVAHAVDTLTEKQLSRETAAWLIGSGTLLLRDSEGNFAFVHRSVMEWLVAAHAAKYLKSSGSAEILGQQEASNLMVDFLVDLAGRETAVRWGRECLKAGSSASSFARANALLVLKRAGASVQEQLILSEEALQGKELTGTSLSKANFSGANLTEAILRGTDVSQANFTGATLDRADFRDVTAVGAKFIEANAVGTNFLGADLADTQFHGADLRYAKFVGAKNATDLTEARDIFGAALPEDLPPIPQISFRSTAIGVALSPDGYLIGIASDSGTIFLWEVSSGKLLRSLEGHRGAAISVAFSGSGEMLASAGRDGTVRLWDAGSGKLLRTLEGHYGVVRSVAFSGSGEMLASAGRDGTVRLWEAASGKLLRTLEGHAEWVHSIAFSRSGEMLASAGDDDTVRLWKAASGKLLRTLEGPPGGPPRGPLRGIRSVAFGGSGEMLASAGGDGTVRLWEANSGKLLRTFEGHDEWVNSVAFSGSGKMLASAGGDGTVRLWEADSGKLFRALEGRRQDQVHSVAFSGSGEMLASARDDGTVQLWDTDSGDISRTLESRKNPVHSVAFSGSGKMLASACRDGTVRLWEVGSGKLFRALEGRHQDPVHSVAFSGSGEILASAGGDATVRLWKTDSGELLQTLEGHEKGVHSVAFSGSGKMLASAGDDGIVRLWDAGSGKLLHILEGHYGLVRSVAFSGSGDMLASAGDDGTVRFWDAGSGKPLYILEGHHEWVNSVAFSGSGEMLASAGGDGTVRLWEADSGKLLRTFDGHQDQVVSVAVSRSGEMLSSVCIDGTVRLWEVGSGKLLRTLEGHEGGIRSVAFSGSGKMLVSAGDDGTVRLWEAGSGELLASLLAATDGWVIWTPCGRYKSEGDISGAMWYAINLCRFELGELDPYLPSGMLQRIGVDEPLWSSDLA